MALPAASRNQARKMYHVGFPVSAGIGSSIEHGQTAGNNEQSDIGCVQFHDTPGSRISSESRSVRGQDGAINLKNREPVPFQLRTNGTTGALRLVTVKALLNLYPSVPEAALRSR